MVLIVTAMLGLSLASSASSPTPLSATERKDLCRRANDWIRDVGAGGPLAQPLGRVGLVAKDGLTKLETAGLDSSQVYQEIGSIREFTTTITNDGRTLRYRALTQELAAAFHRDADSDATSNGPAVAAAFSNVRSFFEQLHAVALVSRQLSPDLTVFRLRLILDEWEGAAAHAAEAMPAIAAHVAPWVKGHLCAPSPSAATAATENGEL